jgi:hypothetical protein
MADEHDALIINPSEEDFERVEQAQDRILFKRRGRLH